MKGDFTRSTFRPEKHYTSVRLQQGRVQLDADWNEQVDIQRYQQQVLQAAFLGSAGAPKVGGGFAITTTTTNGSPDLAISAGRFYLNGFLCELPAGVTYSTQPDYPGAPKLSSLPAGAYIVYLDVWTRHVTSLEDPLLREVALAGPDTTTRTQTVAQVKLLKLPAAIGVLDPIDLTTYIPTSNLRLAARAFSASGQPGTLAPPGSGYLRLDNHLYRVEIHQGGKLGTDPVTYKWSRENGSVITPWIDGSGSTLTVGPIGHEEDRGFAVGGWVEITDEGRELRGEPGVLCQVTRFEGNSLTVSATVNRSDFPANPRIRRWEMVSSTIPALSAAQASGTTWIPLEDGVQIAFTGDTCRTGDYWIIPARTATRDVEWPQQAGAPAFVPRHGEVHHLADLAQLEWTGSAFVANKTLDRRFVFSPLVDYDPQTWNTRLTTHKHTGDIDGSQIPRGGIANNAVDGTKIDPAALVTVTGLTVKGTGAGALLVNGSTKQTGADFFLDSRSNVTDGSNRRALSHDASADILLVNNSGDYSGGMKIGGTKIVAFPGTYPLSIANSWNDSFTSDAKGAAIVNDPVNFKALMIVGNRGNVSAGTSRKVGIWDNLEVNGTILATSHYKQTGTDLQIDNSTSRGGRDGDTRRALVHASPDRLILNYANDYSNGVEVGGQFSINNRSTLNDNTIFLRSLTDHNHGVGFFGSGRRYFAGRNLDGPALYGYAGGALGTASVPRAGVEGAAHLAGSGYIDLDDMNSDDFTNGFTLEATVWWDYKTSSTSTMANWARVVDFSMSSGQGHESILLANGDSTRNLVFQIKGANATNLLTVTATDAIATGQWIHVCVTISGSTVVMYKNGAAIATTVSGTVAVPAARNRTVNYIGKSPFTSSGDDLFYGRIAHVRLWKRALSAAEVADSSSNTRPVDTTDLIGWWPLGDGTARDFSPLATKRNGTLLGGNTTNLLTTYQKAALTWDSSQNVEVIGRLKTGNVRASASNTVTSVQTAGTSYGDVEGLSVGFTLATEAKVWFMANIGATQSESADKVRGLFRIVVVNSSGTVTELTKTAHEFTTNGGWHLRDVVMQTLQTLSAGTYTAKVQWMRDTTATAGTSGSLGCGWYQASRNLMVIEL